MKLEPCARSDLCFINDESACCGEKSLEGGPSECRKALAGWFSSSGKRSWQSGLMMGDSGDRELCGFKRHLGSKINDKFNVGGGVRDNFSFFVLHT